MKSTQKKPHNPTPKELEKARKKIIATIVAVVMLATPLLGTLVLFGVYYKQSKDINLVCQRRMETLGKAFIAYAKDHDDTLPKSYDWTAAIKPYVKNQDAFRCPTDLTEGFTSYAMNDALNEKKLSELKNSDKLVLLYEVKEAGDAPHGDGENVFAIGHEKGGEGRHGINFYRFNYYLFVNGSVDYPRVFKDLGTYYWDNDGKQRQIEDEEDAQ